jgi:hypothetical protein
VKHSQASAACCTISHREGSGADDECSSLTDHRGLLHPPLYYKQPDWAMLHSRQLRNLLLLLEFSSSALGAALLHGCTLLSIKKNEE